MRNLFIANVLMLGVAAFSQTAMANEDLAKKYNCMACHAIDSKLVGPPYKEVAAKYKDDAAAPEALAAKVKAGGSGVWGQIPMPPNPSVPDEDLSAIITWILAQ